MRTRPCMVDAARRGAQGRLVPSMRPPRAHPKHVEASPLSGNGQRTARHQLSQQSQRRDRLTVGPENASRRTQLRSLGACDRPHFDIAYPCGRRAKGEGRRAKGEGRRANAKAKQEIDQWESKRGLRRDSHKQNFIMKKRWEGRIYLYSELQEAVYCNLSSSMHSSHRFSWHGHIANRYSSRPTFSLSKSILRSHRLVAIASS
jgi:hypothetical protein